MYDLIIIGGGPAGAAAGIYAARKKMKTLLLTESFKSQSSSAGMIENWIGIKKISGLELSRLIEEHLKSQEGIEIKEGETALSIKEISQGFAVQTDKNENYQTKTIIIASGGKRRRLGIPGEDEFEGKGVAFCSTCDAPIFKNKSVAVVGSGNAALEAVIDLLPYALKIYLINRGDVIKGDLMTLEKIKESGKFQILMNSEVKEIFGDKFVSGLKYLDKKENQLKELAVGGIFIEIGSVPNSEIAKGLVLMNEAGEIIIDHKTGKTSREGIFAAGDVTDEIYKQNNIAAGDAIAAALSAYNYIIKKL